MKHTLKESVQHMVGGAHKGNDPKLLIKMQKEADSLFATSTILLDLIMGGEAQPAEAKQTLENAKGALADFQSTPALNSTTTQTLGMWRRALQFRSAMWRSVMARIATSILRTQRHAQRVFRKRCGTPQLLQRLQQIQNQATHEGPNKCGFCVSPQTQSDGG